MRFGGMLLCASQLPMRTRSSGQGRGSDKRSLGSADIWTNDAMDERVRAGIPDPVVATAILDRLLHHSHVLTIRATATGSEPSARVGSTEIMNLGGGSSS
jgi:hypothetical protein